jgi:hypothetical protein
MTTINLLKKKLIYTDDYVDVKTALNQMTDDWINDGQYCDHTVASMRDFIKLCIKKLEKDFDYEKELIEIMDKEAKNAMNKIMDNAIMQALVPNQLTEREMFKRSFKRPSNFFRLSEDQQWEIDISLGILD